MISFNEYILKSCNSQASDEDTVIHVGDLGEPTPDTLEFYRELKGKKILVLGNHDMPYVDKWTKVFKSIHYLFYVQTKNGLVCCKHIPVGISNAWRAPADIFIHGHHHLYTDDVFKPAFFSLIDIKKYNACIDLNNYQLATLEDLKRNKPYQLQMFKDDWFKL